MKKAGPGPAWRQFLFLRSQTVAILATDFFTADFPAERLSMSLR
jgi:hypothetical protein